MDSKGKNQICFFFIMSFFFPFLLLFLLVVSSYGSLSLSHSPVLLLLKEGEVACVLLASFTWFFVVVVVLVIASLRKKENVLYQATKMSIPCMCAIHTPPSSLVSSLLLAPPIPPSLPACSHRSPAASTSPPRPHS